MNLFRDNSLKQSGFPISIQCTSHLQS